MKNVVSFYYKFLRTHHARGACYHFGTRIPSVSKMQCTTQRVYSKRDLLKTLTFMNKVCDHQNRIIHQFIELQRQSTRFICMFTHMTWLFYEIIVLQTFKAPFHNLTRPFLDAFRPFGLISRACPVITKNQNSTFAII